MRHASARAHNAAVAWVPRAGADQGDRDAVPAPNRSEMQSAMKLNTDSILSALTCCPPPSSALKILSSRFGLLSGSNFQIALFQDRVRQSAFHTARVAGRHGRGMNGGLVDAAVYMALRNRCSTG